MIYIFRRTVKTAIFGFGIRNRGPRIFAYPMTQSASALAGIRVLDLTRALAGPWCTQNLADLGAEVIKVERPVHGDESRAWGPPWMQDKEGRDSAQSTYFLSCNRNKKSITVDIASPDGQAEI